MTIYLDLFLASNFASTVRNYCNEIGWKIRKINDNFALINFAMDSGHTQTLFIVRYETTIEFSVPSSVKFNNIDEIPAKISSLLLVENSQYKMGFWCVQEIYGKPTLCIMHNAEISLLDVNYFNKVAVKLVKECEKLEYTAIL